MRLNRYILLLSLLVAVSCTNSSELIQAEPDYASVSLSSNSLLLSNNEQSKTIFAATNREELRVECSEDWLDVSVEGGALVLYVDANTSENSRLAVVDVIAGVKPDVAKTRLKVLQQGEIIENLSEAERANCYIVKSSHSYYFDASVKGNGGGDGNSRYVEKVGVAIEGGAYADLAWEATFDGDKTRSTKIIDGTPFYCAERKEIYFTTGEVEGNALIALRDAAGNILWSWHIWVVNDTISTFTGNGLEWLDRNIGALNNEVGDLSNRGMLYQWGRKDPFLPSPMAYVAVPTHTYDEEYNILETEEEYNAIQAEIERVRAVVNVNNTQTGDGSLSWRYVGAVAPVAMNAPGNIDYAVKNPTTFLGCRTDIPIGEYVFDWYLVQDLVGVGGVLQQSQSKLWGDAQKGSDYKSIFDPCPAGYAVPPRGAFGEINSNYACIYVNREWESADYGWIWKGGSDSYFPSTGNLDVSGLIGETSERILYWTAENFGAEASGFGKSATLFVAYNEVYYGIYPLLDPAEAASWYSYGARCCAAPVRCVKQTK